MTLRTKQPGYRHGLRQPTIEVTLRLPLPVDNIDFEAVDGWLEDCFEVNIRPEVEPLHPYDQTNSQGVSLAWRVLEIAATLQRAARLPVFEAGRILDISTDPKSPSAMVVRVAVAKIDFLPTRGTVMALNEGLRLAILAIQHYQKPPDLESVYKKVEKDVIKPLRNMGSSGVSSVPILNAAYLLDIPFRHVGAGVYQLGWGKHSHLMANSAVDEDSAIGARLAQDKNCVAQVILSAGLPAPEHIVVKDQNEALQAAKQLGWPLVVKPADRDRGEGVTVGIHDNDRLSQGYEIAARFSKKMLVEREVAGVCYRLMITNGDFLYAIRRKPKSIIGDGKHTLAELVRLADDASKKAPTWSRGKTITLDALTLKAFALQGLTTESIPKAGEIVALRRIESSEWGGNIEDATHDVHPDNRDIAIRAARLFGLANAGVDIISADIARPWHENGAIINEINYSPYLGGNPIAKAKLPTFFQRFIAGDGRIPVEVMLGGATAMDAGLSRQLEQTEAGAKCYLTSHAETLTSQREGMIFSEQGLFSRTLALLMNRDVGALILVIQTDELLHTGLPVDRIDKIHLCPGNLVRWSDTEHLAEEGAMHALLRLLQIYEAK